MSTNRIEKGEGCEIVTSVIVTWNSGACLRECLQSFRAQDRNLATRIVLVDNASTDDSPKWIVNDFPDVQLIVNDENRGFARACNQGIRVGRGRYFLLLNPDAGLGSGALDEMVAYMDDHPQIGLLAPKILNADGSLQRSCRQFPTYLTAFFNRHSLLTRLFPRNRYSRQFLRFDRSHDQIQEVDWVSGACMLVRREAIEDVGLLDEDFFIYCEDVDWCKRMWAKGWKVVYFPKADVIHHIAKSTSQVPFRMILELHKSIWQYYKKHFRRAPTRDAIIITGVAIRCGFLLVAQLPNALRSALANLAHRDGRRAFVKRILDVW